MTLAAKRTGRLVLVASLLGALFVFFSPGTAAACSCAELGPRAASDADAVFVARADTGASRPKVATSSSGDLGPSEEITFDVEQVFKGSVHQRQRIIFPDGGGPSCGVEITSARVLVFGYRPEDNRFASKQPSGVYSSNACSLKPVKFIEFDLGDLGPHDPPIPGTGPSTRSPSPGGIRSWGSAGVVGATALLILVAAGGWLLIVRRCDRD